MMERNLLEPCDQSPIHPGHMSRYWLRMRFKRKCLFSTSQKAKSYKIVKEKNSFTCFKNAFVFSNIFMVSFPFLWNRCWFKFREPWMRDRKLPHYLHFSVHFKGMQQSFEFATVYNIPSFIEPVQCTLYSIYSPFLSVQAGAILH